MWAFLGQTMHETITKQQHHSKKFYNRQKNT